jgi:NAD(P)-dependent dehydrogenase (short-subunit alcohol dehydrogenase family)
MEFSGKGVLITGGGSGTGKATALKFAERGAKVAVVGRRLDRLNEVVEKINQLGGLGMADQCDLSVPEYISEMVDRVLRSLGRVDILVNNAGILFEKSVMDTELAEWETVMRVNLTSAFLCSRSVLPRMVKQGEGKIVNIASGGGIRGGANGSAYCASKAGMIALTQSLAEEVRHLRINVNAVCPGPVRTEMLDGVSPSIREKLFLETMEPEDVANFVVFLASDASKAMNGQAIQVRDRVRW